ncbi:hypothetical protein BpHYR1_037057 [Brachionus plicatilis]|uniref:Uncharacterized protein n=1 Tax=Brachionus plicatilis TaxID=10195 RepID=A0A3M7PJH5_BRAPC|nr:hypothetical protein BpHYR1_037057 [Brachionus plicatilis]
MNKIYQILKKNNRFCLTCARYKINLIQIVKTSFIRLIKKFGKLEKYLSSFGFVISYTYEQKQLFQSKNHSCTYFLNLEKFESSKPKRSPKTCSYLLPVLLQIEYDDPTFWLSKTNFIILTILNLTLAKSILNGHCTINQILAKDLTVENCIQLKPYEIR